ncbi:putative rhamnan synthesis protein [Candidatus Nanopelagicus abundans]|uniref:Putative rhamnan synthesis protein n=1 Tax=Candidatus Nanopelagicus abundans TaxID=1884916 RepID=A0A249L5G7_9ACTN|nr:hypothetical protein [Candidatus Nanopelagicus abundans]ASY24331.1 putative rhamnan synthesis protein [Candidatus Nanopelagicus abundans]
MKKNKLSESSRDFGFKLYEFISALKDHFCSDSENQEIYVNAKDGTFNEARIFLYVKYSNDYKFTKMETLLFEKVSFEGLKVYIVVNSDLPKPFEFSRYPSIVRKNLGFDLGAYRDFTKRLGPNCQRLVIINDSLLWNPNSFLEIVRNIGDKDGISFFTNSFQPRKHYQSYFVSISGQEAFLEFQNWMKQIRNWRSKFAAVSFGELRNGKILSKVSVIYPYEDLITTLKKEQLSQDKKESSRTDFVQRQVLAKKSLNPTHFFWRELLEKGFPGIKKDLVSRNPSGIPDLSNAVLNEFGFKGVTLLPNNNEMKSSKKIITFFRNLISV